MSTDVKNPDEPTKKDVRFIDGKLKVVELDKKGKVIKIIRDYTGPNPNNKKPRNFKRFRPEHTASPIKENIEGIPIRFIVDSGTDKSIRQEKEGKVDLAHISTTSPVKHEVRFVDDKLKVVEVDKHGKVIKIVRDYPTKLLPLVEVAKPSTEHTAELIIKSTIETLAENVTRGTPRFVNVPEEKIEEKHKEKIRKKVDYKPKYNTEKKVEDRPEEKIEEKPEEIIKGFVNDYPKVKDELKKILYDDGFVWDKDWKRQNAFGMEGGWLNPSSKLSIGIRWGIRSPSAIVYVEKEFADKITQFFDHHDIVAGIATANSDYDLLNEQVVEDKLEEKIEKKPEEKIEKKPEEKIEEKVEIFPPPDIQELLDNDKFYDENTRFIICPECYKYSVKFESEVEGWYCYECGQNPHYDDYKFSDKNKYQIYKLWDMYALMDVAHVKLNIAKRFVASYFKKCCNTKKDKCLYFGIFEEEQITDKFEIAKMNCCLLRENIEENSAVIETIKSLLDEDIQKQIDEEYTFLLQVSGLMTTQLDDYVIATANVDLEKDQPAYVIVDNDNITVDLNPVENMECIECFTWNGVNKGGVVGVSSLPPNSLNELRQMFKLFTEKMNQYINTDALKNISKMEDRIKSLSSEEKKVLSFIHSNKNGCLQNQLWKKLDIDKEKRLAILESLKDLIIKETIKYCSTYTYRLRTIELGILSLELEINNEQMVTEKKIIKKRTYKRKRKEKSE